jgi:membrane protease YdiL (CAAX protease family)
MLNASPNESPRLDRRRIAIFYLLALAIAGSAAVYIWLNGGLAGDLPVPALVILALWYMPAPALAAVLTRALTREGWQDVWLRPRLRLGWPAWLMAWFAPGLLILAGMLLYYAFFPHQFDAELTRLRELMAQGEAASGQPIPFGPEVLLLLQVVQGFLIAPVVNALPVLGEEFGWRAYLQPKLLVLGWRRAMIVMGILWGVWHWPILALGYNYGLDYPGAPWLGMVAFLWFTFTTGTIFGWLTLRGGSVWPAVIGHGALNGMAQLPMLLTLGEPNTLIGPYVIGLLAGLPMAAVGLWCWFNPPTPRQ